MAPAQGEVQDLEGWVGRNGSLMGKRFAGIPGQYSDETRKAQSGFSDPSKHFPLCSQMLVEIFIFLSKMNFMNHLEN